VLGGEPLNPKARLAEFARASFAKETTSEARWLNPLLALALVVTAL
jgi:hypothetical protein